MAAAGHQANAALDETNKSPHILVVNGSIPTANAGYCTIGGKSTEQILRESAAKATAILAVGACAFYGCVQAAQPNPTGAVGVQDTLTDRQVVNVAGCPPIPEVITATIVYVLTYGRTPPVDGMGRPLFGYGARIHDNCPRRAHYDAGQFVQSFGDEASRQGHCLAKMGCKGPDTYAPCPVIKWNMETSFPDSGGASLHGLHRAALVRSQHALLQRSAQYSGPGCPVDREYGRRSGARRGWRRHRPPCGCNRRRPRNPQRERRGRTDRARRFARRQGCLEALVVTIKPLT